MTLEQRQEWGKWYAKKIGFDEEQEEWLLEMIGFGSQAIMPECEYCCAVLKPTTTIKGLPLFSLCDCLMAVSERQQRDDARDRKMKEEDAREWERSRLARASDSGECPSSSVGAEWHGVKRGKDGKKAVDAVQKWAVALCGGEKVGSMYLHGPKGTGKTTLAGLVIQKAIVSGIAARYVRWSGLLYDIKAGWSDKRATDPMSGLRDIKLLIIDDWGKDMGSAWVSQTAS
jgi:DNA replication protein DnaC